MWPISWLEQPKNEAGLPVRAGATDQSCSNIPPVLVSDEEEKGNVAMPQFPKV